MLGKFLYRRVMISGMLSNPASVQTGAITAVAALTDAIVFLAIKVRCRFRSIIEANILLVRIQHCESQNWSSSTA